MSRVLVVASLGSSLIRFRGELIRSLIQAGHSVFACAPEYEDGAAAALELLGVTMMQANLARAGLNPLRDLGYMRTLRRHVRALRPEVVFSYTPKPVIYGGLAVRNMPMVRSYALISGLGYGFGTETLRQRMLTPVIRNLYRLGLSSARRAIFQNPDDMQYFVSERIVAENRCLLVSGSGVDLQHFAVTPMPETPTFLLMARLIPEKGIREYVAAARLVRAANPNARFLLAGWLENRNAAISEQELASWTSEGLIEYLGSLSDVRPALAQASIYVLPSFYREGIPRSVLEAMAMGRAIITTNMPGCRETVRDGQNGCLVEPKNVSTLASAMKRLASDSALVARMGAMSRLMAEQRFGVEQVNEVMMRGMDLA